MILRCRPAFERYGPGGKYVRYVPDQPAIVAARRAAAEAGPLETNARGREGRRDVQPGVRRLQEHFNHARGHGQHAAIFRGFLDAQEERGCRCDGAEEEKR